MEWFWNEEKSNHDKNKVTTALAEQLKFRYKTLKSGFKY